MTKKIVSWLAGMAVFLISWSCRNDMLPEKEAFQNSSSFQLTSQRISLNESKHRQKLSPELSKAETFLKSLKPEVSGKTVSYGNGVSIDTDDVIYIENGPDYHTYTFHIKRENVPGNAPLENLVLSPLSDGSYRELLFTYDLSSAEKQDIIQGIPVDTKGKVSVTELAKGTYNTGGQLARTTRNWQDKTVWVSCSEGLHDGSNFHQCYFVNHPSEGTPPRAYTVEEYVCLLETDQGPGGMDSGGGGGGSSSSGSGGGEGTPSNPPCNGTGILTQPQQPGITDADGCSGIPTIPNLPDPRNNLCEKIKAKFEDPKFKEKVAAIDKSEVFDYDHEMGYAAGYPPANTGVTGTQYPPMENVLGSHSVKLPDGNQYFGYIHSHNNESNGGHPIKIFSPYDVITFLTSCVRNADEHGSIGDAYCMVITSEGNYILQYSGIGDYNIGPNQIQSWKKWYKDNFEELARTDELTQPNVEKTFAQFLAESVNINGLEVYHVEKNTGKASKLNTNGTKTPCP